ncbi:MAG: murein hydrolase activator EnvC [Hyphomicrobiales bacterium]|nr:murein hydrolase activator EnvC [Hyphomicrobiales bacterium]MCP4997442.1 murein hydrolase activator EnvC [Hyphomicrobiales bacterium]
MGVMPFCIGTLPAVRQGTAVLFAAAILLHAATGSGNAQKTSRPEQAKIQALDQQRQKELGELEQIAADIELSKERRAALEQGIDSLKKDQATLRTALVQAAKTQKKLSEDISESELRLASLSGRQDGLKQSLNARRGVLAEVLAALQRMGRNPPPALLVSPEDALSSVRSAILLGAVVPEIREQTERLIADLQELTNIRASIANERELLLATLGEQAEEEEKLKLLLAEKRKLTARNLEQLADEARASRQLAARAKSLEDLIDSLGEEIESVRSAEADARLAEKNRSAESQRQRDRARELARTTTPDANRIAPAFIFSRLKEKLELPVTGNAKFGFGEDDGSGRPLKGMMISTVADAIVTAPADGWVVYSGPFRSYGQLIILNAGDGYHLVIAGMGSTNADIGQFVVAGEPVGRMSSNKVASATALALASTEPTLYIEFRRNGKPVDPAPWWASNPSGRVRNDS